MSIWPAEAYEEASVQQQGGSHETGQLMSKYMFGRVFETPWRAYGLCDL